MFFLGRVHGAAAVRKRVKRIAKSRGIRQSRVGPHFFRDRIGPDLIFVGTKFSVPGAKVKPRIGEPLRETLRRLKRESRYDRLGKSVKRSNY